MDEYPIGSNRYRGSDLGVVTQMLWEQFPNGQLDGFFFKKRCRTDDFLVDFYCREKKLVIIISDDTATFNDYYSDLFGHLYQQGFRVVMFPEKDVKENLNEVVATIHALLNLPGKRRASPGGTPGEGGGGRRNEILQHARENRRHPTPAEDALWKVLRKKNLDGYKFRRQHPMGNYIVDFYCPSKRLVIEVDGGENSEQEEQDTKRTHFMQSQGCRVIRFWNNEVLENMDGVVEIILNELHQ